MRSLKTSRQLAVRVPAVCLERTCMLVCHPEQPERLTRRNYGFIKRRSRALSAGVVAPIPRRLGLTRERNFRDTLLPFCRLEGLLTMRSRNVRARLAELRDCRRGRSRTGEDRTCLGTEWSEIEELRQVSTRTINGSTWCAFRCLFGDGGWHDCSPRHSTLEHLIVKHITF